MREELNYKIDNLLDILDQDSRIINISNIKKRILEDKNFLIKFNKLGELDKYSDEYLELKKEIFTNDDFVSFKEFETEINILIFEINKKLKVLTGKKGCIHENN